MKSFLKNLLALTGLVSIITVLGSLAYVDKKLHDVSNGYKYGPARHLEYLSALLHSFSRSIDVIAADMKRRANLYLWRGNSPIVDSVRMFGGRISALL